MSAEQMELLQRYPVRRLVALLPEVATVRIVRDGEEYLAMVELTGEEGEHPFELGTELPEGPDELASAIRTGMERASAVDPEDLAETERLFDAFDD